MLKRVSSTGIPKDIRAKLHIFFGDLENVGISYIGHGVISDNGDHTGYFSNDQWGEFYLENKFFFTEPILKDFDETKTNLILWNSLEDSNAVAFQRKQFVNLISGMTIHKKENQYNTFFNLGFSKDPNLVEFSFFKRDLLLAYFKIFNDYHLSWRKDKNL